MCVFVSKCKYVCNESSWGLLWLIQIHSMPCFPELGKVVMLQDTNYWDIAFHRLSVLFTCFANPLASSRQSCFNSRACAFIGWVCRSFLQRSLCQLLNHYFQIFLPHLSVILAQTPDLLDLLSLIFQL